MHGRGNAMNYSNPNQYQSNNNNINNNINNNNNNDINNNQIIIILITAILSYAWWIDISSNQS